MSAERAGNLYTRATMMQLFRYGNGAIVSPNAPTTAQVIMASGTIRIGISGWKYPPWRGAFYPKGLTQKQELSYASQQCRAIEINNPFYGLQRPDSFGRWRDETPAGFVFTVKGSRYI